VVAAAARPAEGGADVKTETRWRWLTPIERAKRDGRIRELYAMGWDRREIAAVFDLTPQRVDQIVRKR
jgi:hypothetical protein